ncbi:MAG: hypothetical protein DLM57_02940 [Pseudonocardiales bacterium]|nr:MAG: hypothetical protein DLM57_02940 [Pseudonocardiales bacterium]
MTMLSWLALAAGVAMLPLPSVTGRRTLWLAGRGRLAAIPQPVRLPRFHPPAGLVALLSCAACAAAAGVLGGVVLGIAAAVIAGTVATVLLAAMHRRRAARRRRGLLAAVRLLVAELEVGSRPAAALGAAAAVAADHGAVLARAAGTAAAGGDVAGLLFRCGDVDLAPLAHAWRAGTLVGAPMADVLARVAADLADRERQQRAVAVALAGPNSSAALLAGLPVVGIALGAAMGARPLGFLLGAPGGRALCCVGVVLDAAGVLWTQQLTTRAQRG